MLSNPVSTSLKSKNTTGRQGDMDPGLVGPVSLKFQITYKVNKRSLILSNFKYCVMVKGAIIFKSMTYIYHKIQNLKKKQMHTMV